MSITEILQAGHYNQAIQQFVQSYQKVNCILLLPLEGGHFTVQLPVTDSMDRADVCRYDFILSDPETKKILRHGFMQFPYHLICGYSYEAGMLSFQLSPNMTLRFVGN